MQIANPWHQPHNIYSKKHYEVGEPLLIEDGIAYYKLPVSVLAVESATNKALTECVTVRGCRRLLKQTGMLP